MGTELIATKPQVAVAGVNSDVPQQSTIVHCAHKFNSLSLIVFYVSVQTCRKTWSHRISTLPGESKTLNVGSEN